MVAGAIAILPVRADVRWTILLLAGIDWPVAYAIKLGQVGPLLLLLFAIGWRYLERPAVVGGVAAVGTLVKLQPALLFGWALLARRTRALAIGLLVLAAVVLVTLPLVGIGAYADYAEVLRRVASPVTTPNNVTPGAILYRAGLGAGVATVIQLVVMAGALLAWFVASRWRTPAVGFVVTVVASQLLSPLLWDHYAVLLLIPAALLLEWGRRWAVLIPLATCSLVAWVVPAPIYQTLLITAFAVALVAPILVAAPAAPVALGTSRRIATT
jgi:hypothetical protein